MGCSGSAASAGATAAPDRGPARAETAISLAAASLSGRELSAPVSQSLCESVWASYTQAPNVGNLVALVSVVGFKAPQTGVVPCRAALEDRIRQRVRVADDLGGTLLQLQFMVNGPIGVEGAIMEYPALMDGSFFPDASPAQRLILRAAVCGPMGKVLQFGDGGVAGSIRWLTVRSDKFTGSFAAGCIEREARRLFIEGRVGS